MRVACNLILACGLLLMAGCSRVEATTPAVASGGSVDTRAAALQTAAEAEAAGKRALEAPGFQWIEAPRLALAEEMSYEEAVKKIGVGEGQYDVWSAETRVWLIIFQGRWLLTPMGPSQPPPQPIAYEGCLLVVVAAEDGSRISVGDAACPGQ